MANLTRKERFAREFGKNVRRTRESFKIGLVAFAKGSSVDIGNISKIERGLVTPRLDTAWKLAEALGVPLEKLKP